jgi:hypothetical protein
MACSAWDENRCEMSPTGYDTSRKIAGSIHDEVFGFLSSPNPTNRTDSGVDSASNRNGYQDSSCEYRTQAAA